MKSNELLKMLIKELFNTDRNRKYCQSLNVGNSDELQNILRTKSKHNNLVKGLTETNEGFLMVELTTKGIHYYNNNFKFDKDLSKTEVNVNIENNHGILAGINYGSQNSNIEIDEILKVLESKKINHKEDIILFLKQFQESKNRSYLEKALSYIGSSASAGSFLIAILSMLNSTP